MSWHCACIVNSLRCIVCQSICTWLHLFVLKGFWMINQQLMSAHNVTESQLWVFGQNRVSSVWTRSIIDFLFFFLHLSYWAWWGRVLSRVSYWVSPPSTHRETEEVRGWQQRSSDKEKIIISVANGRLSGFGSGFSSQWVNLCGTSSPKLYFQQFLPTLLF